MASSLAALPRFWHDLGKNAMATQDRAKAIHDLGKDAMINHVPCSCQGFHGNQSAFLVTPSVRKHGILARSMSPLAALDVIPVLHSDLIP